MPHKDAALLFEIFGNARKALHHANEANKIDPKRVEAYLIAGRLLMLGGQLQPAIQSLEKAKALQPSSLGAVRNLANCWHLIGDQKKAVESAREFREAVIKSKGKNDAQSYANRSLNYKGLGMTKEVKDDQDRFRQLQKK